jgi:predicted O-methyltransferase YrrM
VDDLADPVREVQDAPGVCSQGFPISGAEHLGLICPIALSDSMSKIRSAGRILKNEGPSALSKKAGIYALKQTPVSDDILYRLSVRDIQKRMREESELDDILDVALEYEPGYERYQLSTSQLRDEIKSLAELVRDHKPQNVLEIGTSNGGSFYIWCRYLKNTTQLTSLDLPGGRFGGGYNEQKVGIYEKFAPSKDLEFVRANSHEDSTFEEVNERINGDVDFLFIDGDHTYEGVKADFEMYKELVADDGLIAFHDIVHHPNREEVVENRRSLADIEKRHLNWGENFSDCNVDKLWNELTDEYETTEFISHPKQTWAGIGVIHL